jgi:multidrug resistance efflux pump
MRKRIIIIVLALAILAGVAFVINYLYQNSLYVTTDNARVTAPLIPVASLGSGQMISLDVDYGTKVTMGQRVARVGQPRPSDVTSALGFKATPATETMVEAPVSGYVAAIWTYPGAIIGAGQQIVTLYDSSNVFVLANINENDLNRVQPGQPVQINIDSMGGSTIGGKVIGIAGATAASFSILPQQSTSGNFIKVAQVVPVKIAIDNPGSLLLIPGTSVEVKINTKK